MRCIAARREDGFWRVTLRDETTTRVQEVTARLLINAAGPWVSHVLSQAIGQNETAAVRLVKGSHIVMPRLYDHDRCYIFQNADGRIIFAIPYERDFTLIGTTDIDYEGDPGEVAASESEIDYLCAAASEYFKKPITREQMVWSYAGVRPLYDDGAGSAQEATRDYVLRLQNGEGEPPLVNIFGGKITTFRRLSESVMKMVEKTLGKRGAHWTASAKLPGGEFPVTGFKALCGELAKAFPFLMPDHIFRLARAYGTETRKLLTGIETASGLGRHFGGALYEAEVRYLMENEWARTADDVLWRRSKLGLRLTQDQAAALNLWMTQAADAPALKAAQS